MIYIFLWLTCGVIQWGVLYAYFVRKYPKQHESRWVYFWMALTGPIGLLSAFAALCQFNGVKNVFKYGFKL